MVHGSLRMVLYLDTRRRFADGLFCVCGCTGVSLVRHVLYLSFQLALLYFLGFWKERFYLHYEFVLEVKSFHCVSYLFYVLVRGVFGEFSG